METIRTNRRACTLGRIIIAMAILLLVFSTTVKAGDLDAVVGGNTDFAFDLHKQLTAGGKDDNVFFSPFSISMALAMTYAGARGQTEKEMAHALHFSLPQKQLHPAFSQLMARLNTGKGYQLSCANALWGQKNMRFMEDFLRITRTDYQGGLKEVNFVDDPEGSRKIINGWVEDKTQKKIVDLLGEGDINSNTRLVLTNAIYFKGTWVTRFDPKMTREAPFYTNSGKTVTVPMMNAKARFGYMDDDLLQMIELPYAGDDLSMIVLLPRHEDGLAKIEQMLTAKKLQEWRSRLMKEQVTVFLPKFKTTSRFVLNTPLEALGMSDAFAMSADFSGMTGRPNLVISKVIHKAFVDVNEEGTEAAAATAVVMMTKGVSYESVFRADRPFVFAILDKRTGSVLFLGKLMNPKQD